jgi:hypothetical protein
MTRAACAAGLICVALSWTAHAQSAAAPRPAQPAPLPPPAFKTGNPTPGTPQPPPPNVVDRIIVVGCLQMAPGAGAAPASAATEPAHNRFVLTGAKRDGAASAASYRLEALESLLSPFIDTRVELSGETKAQADGTPVLLVEAVRKLAATCP